MNNFSQYSSTYWWLSGAIVWSFYFSAFSLIDHACGSVNISHSRRPVPPQLIFPSALSLAIYHSYIISNIHFASVTSPGIFTVIFPFLVCGFNIYNNIHSVSELILLPVI